MKTVFFETVNDDDKYITVAVVDSNSKIDTFQDLRGKKACFPNFDGVAWNSVIYTLKNSNLLDSCPFNQSMGNFFGDSCVPNLPNSLPNSLKRICKSEMFNGDEGALRCLNEGHGDVAFVSRNNLMKYKKGRFIMSLYYFYDSQLQQYVPQRLF